RLPHEWRALRFVEPVRFPALQDLQRLRQGDAARRRRRRGDDLPAAVAEADRLALLDGVGRQFLQGPLPAFGVHALDQLACNLAAVEAVMAVLREQFEGAGEVRLSEQVGYARRR